MQHKVYSEAWTVFHHTKKYIKWCCHSARHYRNDSKTNTWNKYIVRFQFKLCTQKDWERGLKKWILLPSYSQQHDSHWQTNRSDLSVHGSQFHKQTVVYTQWNLIRPFKVSNSDNATMWTNLMVIRSCEINQTKKRQTFCDSTHMRYPNKSNLSEIAEWFRPIEKSSCFMDLSFPWKNWLPVISPKPIRQIIGSYIQSNECRHNVIYSVHQTHSNFLTDKRQNCIYGTSA